MTLIRRRDHAILEAEIVRPGDDVSLPILFVGGEPFPPGETVGYYLHEASDAELAELQRGGYTLLRSVRLAS
jgi:hypothetical protein